VVAASENKSMNLIKYSRVTYDLKLANKGLLGFNLKKEKFINAENIAFIDYKHFNGNQTRVGQTERYLNVFNLFLIIRIVQMIATLEFHSEYNDTEVLL
jgi:hypothetical protein